MSENQTGMQDTELVVVGNQSLVDQTDDIIASAERRIANVQKILSLALKITNAHDWIDQAGKPYLAASGAEKVARLFGVCWSNIKSEKIVSDDEKGKFYFYQVSGVFSLKSDTILAIGTCSSKDQFFAKHKEKNSETGEYETVLKPISEVDETNIMKSAYSNCVANGVTRLLGLRNLTWDQVTHGSGISKDKVASVTYAGGGAGGGLISEAQGKRLWAISKNSDVKESELKAFLKENYNIESSREIERKDYEAICKWVEGQKGIPKQF